MRLQKQIRKVCVRISLCIGFIYFIGCLSQVFSHAEFMDYTRFAATSEQNNEINYIALKDDEPIVPNIPIETKQDNKHEYSRHRNMSVNITYGTKIAYNVDALYRDLQDYHDNAYSVPKHERCIIRPPGSVILGVAKSGTQELVDFLSIHPNVIRKSGLASIDLFNRTMSGKSNYIGKDNMPCTYADQIGIGKADHFFSDVRVPEKLFNFDKYLKMILIVREPVERMISAFSFTFLQKKQHKLQFTYNIKDVPEIDSQFVDVKTGKVKLDIHYFKESTYDENMEQYLKYFSRDQILVIESGEFKSNPVNVLQMVVKFLGLKSFITDDHFVYNTEKQFYCLRTTSGMTCYGSDRGRAKLKDIKPETRQKMKEYFKPHNERFFEQIGRRFDWD